MALEKAKLNLKNISNKYTDNSIPTTPSRKAAAKAQPHRRESFLNLITEHASDNKEERIK